MQPMVMWSINEILEARKALAKIFSWKREVDNDFTVVYGLQVTDYAGITASEMMVPREFCDKFHNPRHLPAIIKQVRYIPPKEYLPASLVVYTRIRTFSNGTGYNIPTKWWDKDEEVVEQFTTHMFALDRMELLNDHGVKAHVDWNDVEKVWEVYYYGQK